MQNIKLSHLRVFYEVAEQGSISGAAERLFRSPSAVSMMVANLEQRLEKPLFEAEGKSRLTPFGRYVHQIAHRQLAQFDRSVAKIEAFARNEFGHIDVCSVPSFATAYLPKLLIQYKSKFPNTIAVIRDNSSSQITNQVANGEIDIGISGPPDTTDAVSFIPILTDVIGLVCRSSHPICKMNRKLTWSDLADQTFISNGTCDLIQADEFRSVCGRSTIAVQNTTSLLAMVSSGLGITTLPRLAVPMERKDIAFLEFRYKNLSRQLGLTTRKNRTLTPAATAFYEIVIDEFHQ